METIEFEWEFSALKDCVPTELWGLLFTAGEGSELEFPISLQPATLDILSCGAFTVTSGEKAHPFADPREISADLCLCHVAERL